MDLTPVIRALSEKVDPLLEEGKTYYSFPVNEEYGTSDGMLFCIQDGIIDYESYRDLDEKLLEIELEHDKIESIFSLTRTFPSNTRVRYIFQKGKTIQVQVCDFSMLREFWELELKTKLYRVNIVKVQVDVKFRMLDKKLNYKGTKITTCVDSTIKTSDKVFDKNLVLLYHFLGGKLKRLQYVFEDGHLSFASQPGFPEWNIPEIKEEEEVIHLDATNPKAVFSFLESLNEKKISMALKLLDNNPELKAKAEGRYLNLIRTRLKKPDATLESLSDEKVINEVYVSLMLKIVTDEDFFSFDYMDDHETCFIVDYFGSMVSNAFSCNNLIEEVKQVKEEGEISEIHQKYGQILKSWINKELEAYADGWFGKLNDKFFGMCNNLVRFDHTKFALANKSLVMNEFMFFLGQGSNYITFDIFQSTCPQFGPMFWLLPEVPETIWGDVKPEFPKSLLTFERTARYRIGDKEDAWENYKSQ